MRHARDAGYLDLVMSTIKLLPLLESRGTCLRGEAVGGDVAFEMDVVPFDGPPIGLFLLEDYMGTTVGTQQTPSKGLDGKPRRRGFDGAREMDAEDVIQSDGGFPRSEPGVRDDDAFEFVVVGQVFFVHPHL